MAIIAKNWSKSDKLVDYVKSKINTFSFSPQVEGRLMELVPGV